MDKKSQLNALIKTLCNGNASEFARRMNVTQGCVSGWLSRGKMDIELIAETFPEISAEWLLRGEGDMYRNSGNQSIIMENKGIVGNNNSGNSVNIGSTPNIVGEGEVSCGLSLKYHNVEIPMEKILELIKSIKL